MRARLSQISSGSSSVKSEPPFGVPEDWYWARGYQLLSVIRGVTYKKSEASDVPLEGYLPLLRANNIRGMLNFDNLVYVPRNLISEQQIIRTGDVLIAMSSGSKALVGKAAQAQENFQGSFGAFCGLLRLTEAVFNPYLAWYFQSPLYRLAISASSQGIGINNLRKGNIEELFIPVPPLEEQKRIVAKVDELMALCDDLETQQQTRVAARSRLNTVALGRLSNASDEASFKQTWARVGSAFDTLYSTPETIAELRKTILQLAVQGKLVRQDPDDEPAEKLLEAISGRRKQMLKEKQIKRTKELEAIQASELPFSVPGGWQWVRLGDLCFQVSDGPHFDLTP